MTNKQRDKLREQAMNRMIAASQWLCASEDQDIANELSVLISAVERRRAESSGDSNPD